MSISRQKNIEYLKANPDDWDLSNSKRKGALI